MNAALLAASFTGFQIFVGIALIVILVILLWSRPWR